MLIMHQVTFVTLEHKKVAQVYYKKVSTLNIYKQQCTYIPAKIASLCIYVNIVIIKASAIIATRKPKAVTCLPPTNQC